MMLARYIIVDELEKRTAEWTGDVALLTQAFGGSLRHTFAKNLLINEVQLETVSLLLGHKKVGDRREALRPIRAGATGLNRSSNQENTGTWRAHQEIGIEIAA
jgi:hypothetical protein